MTKHMTLILQLSLIMISIVMIGCGVYRDEVSSVFSKAVKLCLECVGIG